MIFIKPNPETWKVYYQPDSQEWVGYHEGWKNQKEKDNFVFDATISPKGCFRGRSAAGFYFQDTLNGDIFTMRIQKLSEFLEAILDGKVKQTQTGWSGRFTFFKQGENYTIGLYKE